MSFQDRFRFIKGRLGVASMSFKCVRVDLGSRKGRFRIISGSLQGPFGVVSGSSFLERCFRVFSGSFLGHFSVMSA